MRQTATYNKKIMPLAGFMATGLILCALPVGAFQGKVTPPASTATDTAPATGHKTSPARKTSSYRPVSVPSSAMYYQSVWGIDNLLVRETSSGSLIRFSYRVLDPVRARALGDERATPYLYGQRSRALLQIPVIENVGPLRQARAPVAGKRYWMTFSNKGNLVKAGDRVDVIIGSFHAEGLMVE